MDIADNPDNHDNHVDNWTDIIKNESHENLKPIKHNVSLINDMEHVEMIHIDEFISNDDIDLLKRSSIVARNLKFYINKKYISVENESNKECYDIIFKSIEWLSDCTELLANRNHQSIIKSTSTENVITRNSYKFCEFNHECKFNYTSVDVRCYAQHFVYNLVNDDIVDVLRYIQLHKNDLNINEIKISINTITYVLNHMFDELSKLKVCMPDKYQQYVDRKYRFKSNVSTSKVKQKNIKMNHHLC